MVGIYRHILKIMITYCQIFLSSVYYFLSYGHFECPRIELLHKLHKNIQGDGEKNPDNRETIVRLILQYTYIFLFCV